MKTIKINCCDPEIFKSKDDLEYTINKNTLFLIPSKSAIAETKYDLSSVLLSQSFKDLNMIIRKYARKYFNKYNLYKIFKGSYLNSIIENNFDKSRSNIINYMNEKLLPDSFEIAINRMITNTKGYNCHQSLINIANSFILKESKKYNIAFTRDVTPSSYTATTYSVIGTIHDLLLDNIKFYNITDIEFPDVTNSQRYMWKDYVIYNVFIEFIDYLRFNYIFELTNNPTRQELYMLNEYKSFWIRNSLSINSLHNSIKESLEGIIDFNNRGKGNSVNRKAFIFDRNNEHLKEFIMNPSSETQANYLNSLFLLNNLIESSGNYIFEESFNGLTISEKIKASFDSIINILAEIRPNIDILVDSLNNEAVTVIVDHYIDYRYSDKRIDGILDELDSEDDKTLVKGYIIDKLGDILTALENEIYNFCLNVNKWVIGTKKLALKYANFDVINECYEMLNSDKSLTSIDFLEIHSDIVDTYLSTNTL